MSVFLLGFLFVVVIPLAEGVLFALLLREIHIRHPLPLGGIIETAERRRMRETKRTVEAARAKEKAKEQERVLEQQDVPIVPPAKPVTEEATSSPVLEEEQVLVPSAPLAVDVFDEATHIPDNVPVNEVLDSMTTESSVGIPNDFETRIEASARSDDELPSAVHDISDEMNADDLNALAAALPRDKIDFSQELDSGIASSPSISPMAKELLGEHFDFDNLESQSAKMAALVSEAVQSAELTDAVLQVQEDESGTVQVSSPFLSNSLLQYTDFIVPQTIFPSFSQDWVQESEGTAAPMEDAKAQFCFTEEMPPMLVRKKKSS